VERERRRRRLEPSVDHVLAMRDVELEIADPPQLRIAPRRLLGLLPFEHGRGQADQLVHVLARSPVPLQHRASLPDRVHCPISSPAR
jgi:hypothetical protein